VLSGSGTSSRSDLNCPPSQKVEVNGRFVCQQAPVQPSQSGANNAASPANAGWAVASGEPAPSKPTMSVSGTYLGTVHNKTANLSSTFTAVLHQAKGGTLEGCMAVEPPLYGSGALHGSVRGSRVTFIVGDITFQGDVSSNGVTGSYVVTREGGNQLGDFRLMKQEGAESSNRCDNGVVAKVASPSSQQFSDVPPGYKVLPPAANLTGRVPNAATTGSTPPYEIHPISKLPDLSNLTSSERQSIEAACSQAKYLQGPAAYDQCLVRQIQSWSTGPKQPDLSNLTSSERQSIEAACSQAKYLRGPAAYDQCLVRQIQSWLAGPKQPDLSSLTSSERQSIESACSQAKFLEGPASYNRCLVRQLQALTDYHQ
jgi:hypothetical protein